MNSQTLLDPEAPAVQLGDISVNLRESLLGLHRQGNLVPWLKQLATRALLLEQASSAGLTVTEEELQQAADQFRQGKGLFLAEHTLTWLNQQAWSKNDFEEALREELLLEKFKRRVTESRVLEQYQSSPGNYDRLRLTRLLVATEPLAREILSQVQEEGADLSTLARQHSQLRDRSEGGKVEPLFRAQLAPPIREALHGIQAGSLVGPIATPEGFYLVQVDEVVPAELDAGTVGFLTEEAFSAWLGEKLAGARLSFPLLERLA